MLIRFGFEISISCPSDVPMLLALSVHPDFSGRLIGNDVVRTSLDVETKEYRDRFDNRITRLVAPKGDMILWSDCVAEVDGKPDPALPDTPQHAVEDLPAGTLAFLTASRYCDSDVLSDFAWRQFGYTAPGWTRVQAISDFAHNETTFGYKFGRATKTANEVFQEKTGVCRDFAHLAISFCRAMNIPARYASGYLGDIGVPYSGPGDFCAWFEVFLGGQWHTFDARYNKPRIGRILMVRGGDAADVAMVTSFGSYDLKKFTVWTDEIADDLGDSAVHELLKTRPEAEALVEETSARLAG